MNTWPPEPQPSATSSDEPAMPDAAAHRVDHAGSPATDRPDPESAGAAEPTAPLGSQQAPDSGSVGVGSAPLGRDEPAPGLPSMADLDGLALELDEVDATLARLDSGGPTAGQRAE